MANSQLDSIFGALLQPDNTIRKNAEQFYTKLEKNEPLVVLQYLLHIQTSYQQDASLRMLSAVLVKRFFKSNCEKWALI